MGYGVSATNMTRNGNRRCQSSTCNTGVPRSSDPPPQDPAVALCLGTHGDPMGVGVSYARGTLPVCKVVNLEYGPAHVGLRIQFLMLVV